MFWDTDGGVTEYVAALSIITVTSGLEGPTDELRCYATDCRLAMSVIMWLWLCYAAHNSTTQTTDHCCPSDMQTFVNATSGHTCSTVGANLANIAFCQSS